MFPDAVNFSIISSVFATGSGKVLVFHLTQRNGLLFEVSRCMRAFAYPKNIISVNHPRVYPHTYLTNSFLFGAREQGYARRSTDLTSSGEITLRLPTCTSTRVHCVCYLPVCLYLHSVLTVSIFIS